MQTTESTGSSPYTSQPFRTHGCTPCDNLTEISAVFHKKLWLKKFEFFFPKFFFGLCTPTHWNIYQHSPSYSNSIQSNPITSHHITSLDYINKYIICIYIYYIHIYTHNIRIQSIAPLPVRFYTHCRCYPRARGYFRNSRGARYTWEGKNAASPPTSGALAAKIWNKTLKTRFIRKKLQKNASQTVLSGTSHNHGYSCSDGWPVPIIWTELLAIPMIWRSIETSPEEMWIRPQFEWKWLGLNKIRLKYGTYFDGLCLHLFRRMACSNNLDKAARDTYDLRKY